MLDVVLALVPALIVGTVVLGFRALLVTLISMAAAVVAVFDFLLFFSLNGQSRGISSALLFQAT